VKPDDLASTLGYLRGDPVIEAAAAPGGSGAVAVDGVGHAADPDADDEDAEDDGVVVVSDDGAYR
jgi:hypothetical protein